MESISPARLYEDQKEELHLELLTESLASRREITVSDTNRPGMALMGFVENFLSERIQILAQTEFAYLATLPDAQMRQAVDRLFQFSIPLIVVCKALNVPDRWFLAIVAVDGDSVAEPIYLRRPFASAPDPAATSVNYAIKQLLEQGEIAESGHDS